MNDFQPAETRSLTPTQYTFNFRDVAAALYAALVEDAFYIAMEKSVIGDASQRREAMLRYYDYAMQEGHRYGLLFIPGGQSCGASIWSRPVKGRMKRQMADEKQTFLKTHMGEASLAAYLGMTDAMTRQTTAAIPHNSWYLSIVGIAPSSQRQGLGRSLIEPVLERTAALGVCTYLETFTPRNMSFYRRLGYQETAVCRIMQTPYWVMVRHPHSSGRLGTRR